MTTRTLPTNLTLTAGSHLSPDEGMCLLEAVAYVAGEPHTDSPKCASEVIAGFGRMWNDALDDEQRQRLRPYIYRLVGSRGTTEQEKARSWMAYDWLVRTHTVAWLRLAGLSNHADVLAGLPEIVNQSTIDLARPTINAVRDPAWTSASTAVEVAAGVTARNTARAATEDAAGVASWNSAWTAAGAAGWAAARDALITRDELIESASIRDELIESAHDLMDRMLKVTEA